MLLLLFLGATYFIAAFIALLPHNLRKCLVQTVYNINLVRPLCLSVQLGVSAHSFTSQHAFIKFYCLASSCVDPYCQCVLSRTRGLAKNDHAWVYLLQSLYKSVMDYAKVVRRSETMQPFIACKLKGSFPSF